MDRIAKVKIVMDIAKEYNMNMTTVMFMLAVSNDKALTKVVKEFQEKVAQVN